MYGGSVVISLLTAYFRIVCSEYQQKEAKGNMTGVPRLPTHTVTTVYCTIYEYYDKVLLYCNKYRS